MQTVQIRRGRSKSRSQGGAPTASPAQCIIVGSKEIPYPAKKSRRKVWNRTKQGISELVHRNNMGFWTTAWLCHSSPRKRGATQQAQEPGAWGAATKKRRRCVHLHVMVTPEEQALIRERMAEAGISNMGGLYAENGFEWLCTPCWPLGHPGAGVPPAAERQQPQPSSDPCEHLRRHLPPRDQGPATGLRRPLGGRFPIFWKSCPRLFLYKKRAGKNPAPFLAIFFTVI